MPEVREHRIEYVDVELVEGWPDNSKAHDIYLLRLSYKHNGFVNPVIKDENSGRLVAGHGRIEALKQMRDEGEAPPAGIQLGADQSWAVPVVRGVSFVDEEHARAYVVADNQITIKGGWDTAKFKEQLSAIEAAGLLDAAGSTIDDLEDLLATLGEVPEVEDVDFKGGYAESPEEQASRAAIVHQPHREVVMLFLEGEHTLFAAQVQALKKAWELETLKAVVNRAFNEAIAAEKITVELPELSDEGGVVIVGGSE